METFWGEALQADEDNQYKAREAGEKDEAGVGSPDTADAEVSQQTDKEASKRKKGQNKSIGGRMVVMAGGIGARSTIPLKLNIAITVSKIIDGKEEKVTTTPRDADSIEIQVSEEEMKTLMATEVEEQIQELSLHDELQEDEPGDGESRKRKNEDVQMIVTIPPHGPLPKKIKWNGKTRWDAVDWLTSSCKMNHRCSVWKNKHGQGIYAKCPYEGRCKHCDNCPGKKEHLLTTPVECAGCSRVHCTVCAGKECEEEGAWLVFKRRAPERNDEHKFWLMAEDGQLLKVFSRDLCEEDWKRVAVVDFGRAEKGPYVTMMDFTAELGLRDRSELLWMRQTWRHKDLSRWKQQLGPIDNATGSRDTNDPPRVALLGSGGGQRAQIALLGVLRQLGEDNLLDSFLYLAGVSGTTWAMASLYDDAQWSKNAPSVVRGALQSMSEGSSSSFSECVQWLRRRDAEGDLSLTDFWGVVACNYFKGVPLETRTLAEEDQGDGANPYPLYSAVERVLLDNEKEELWFELSPHEVGFTHPGAFVKTSLLRQDFDGGQVNQQNRMPVDMVQLQGRQEIVMLSSFKLLERFNDMEGSYKVLEELKSELDGYPGLHSSTLLEFDCNIWTKMTDEEKKQQIRIIFQELNESLEQQSQGMRILNNPVNDDPKVPEHMCKEKIMHLVDAGLFLNSPYPPMLTDTRDIDLIVSFDFSAGDPFETVKVAHRYSATCGMSFPQINEDDMNEDRPMSFHVLEEMGKPTVIHIPLFNMDNCKDEATIKKEQDEYTTFQAPYREQKKINDLADLAAENVKMNRERILEEIRKAAERRKAQC
ncbi:hypothetical protein ACEWY4_017833 [Coilia grayii]|uniref:PLA2c domain-containing protein n=1 Tax=Coilia grayii TaxID=363190 RepID=A0ABD1JI59_9TELE